VLSAATEGKELRYGSNRMPIELWGPWRTNENVAASGLGEVQRSVRALFQPAVLLDILANFTLFATDKKKRRLKIVCRYQQYEGANRIVESAAPRRCLGRDEVRAWRPKATVESCDGAVAMVAPRGRSIMVHVGPLADRLARAPDAKERLEGRMLHEFLSAHRDELITRTRAKVVRRGEPAADRAELEHGVPLFLTQLTQILSEVLTI
jgi:hypothetical protein